VRVEDINLRKPLFASFHDGVFLLLNAPREILGLVEGETLGDQLLENLKLVLIAC
jgi:hypothetical protein